MKAPNKTPLTIDEAAEFLKVSKSFLYKLTSNGTIKHYKPGRRIVFLESDLLSFIEESKVHRRSPDEIKSQAAKHAMGL